MSRRLILAALGAATIVATFQALAADLVHGKQVFAACAACHTEKPDAIGPSLRGIVGRKSATLDSFRYSGPMRRANLVWDEMTLRQFVANPRPRWPGRGCPSTA